MTNNVYLPPHVTDRHRERGRIERVRICHFHDEPKQEPNTFWLHLVFGGSGQGFGGFCLPVPLIKAAMAEICKACGVADPELLTGVEVYALRATSTWGDSIVGIESVQTGQRFVMRDFLRKHLDAEHLRVTEYEERIDSRLGHLAAMRRQIDDVLSRIKQLPLDFVEWSETDRAMPIPPTLTLPRGRES